MRVREKGWEPAATDVVGCRGRRVGGISAVVAAAGDCDRCDGFIGRLGEDEERDVWSGGGVALQGIRDGEGLRSEDLAGEVDSILSKVECGGGKLRNSCGRGPLGGGRMGMGVEEQLLGELGAEWLVCGIPVGASRNFTSLCPVTDSSLAGLARKSASAGLGLRSEVSEPWRPVAAVATLALAGRGLRLISTLDAGVAESSLRAGGGGTRSSSSGWSRWT